MRPEYEGVKFYSAYDWSIKEQLEKAIVILQSFDENNEYADVNKVIELYNVQKLINSGATLEEWNEEITAHYKKLCSSFMKVFGKFFGKINDENFRQICQSVCIGYVEDFWELFEMSSEHIVFSSLSGFVKDKYAYGNSSDVENEQFLLFSGQSLLGYIEKTQSKYTNLFDLLIHEHIKI